MLYDRGHRRCRPPTCALHSPHTRATTICGTSTSEPSSTTSSLSRPATGRTADPAVQPCWSDRWWWWCGRVAAPAELDTKPARRRLAQRLEGLGIDPAAASRRLKTLTNDHEATVGATGRHCHNANYSATSLRVDDTSQLATQLEEEWALRWQARGSATGTGISRHSAGKRRTACLVHLPPPLTLRRCSTSVTLVHYSTH